MALHLTKQEITQAIVGSQLVNPLRTNSLHLVELFKCKEVQLAIKATKTQRLAGLMHLRVLVPWKLASTFKMGRPSESTHIARTRIDSLDQIWKTHTAIWIEWQMMPIVDYLEFLMGMEVNLYLNIALRHFP